MSHRSGIIFQTLSLQKKQIYCMPSRCKNYTPGLQRSLILRKSTVTYNTRNAWTRTIHTSAPRKALPPVLLLLMRPVAKLSAAIFGRVVRWWWKSMPQSKKDQLIQKLKRNKFYFLAFLAPASAGSYYFYVSHLEVDSLCERKRFIAFSEKQMVQLAEFTQKAVIAEFKEFILPPAHPCYRRVVRIANSLLRANQEIPAVKDLNWTVFIVDQPLIKNAFVLPNGSIFVFSGMLSVCNNDDQLAIILAHEISHVLLRHMAERLSSMHLTEFVLFFPLLLVWAIVPYLGAIVIQWLSDKVADVLIHLPFSRNTEFEADVLGLGLAAKACVDVREASAFWMKMHFLSAPESDENLEWLSTHPSYETRYQYLDSLLPAAFKIREDYKCPKLPRLDPRLDVELLKLLDAKVVNNQKVLI